MLASILIAAVLVSETPPDGEPYVVRGDASPAAVEHVQADAVAPARPAGCTVSLPTYQAAREADAVTVTPFSVPSAGESVRQSAACEEVTEESKSGSVRVSYSTHAGLSVAEFAVAGSDSVDGHCYARVQVVSGERVDRESLAVLAEAVAACVPAASETRTLRIDWADMVAREGGLHKISVLLRMIRTAESEGCDASEARAMLADIVTSLYSVQEGGQDSGEDVTD